MADDAIADLRPVVGAGDVLQLIEWARGVTVSEPVMMYIIDLCQATRSDPSLLIGASTRASLALMRAARVVAASHGREDVYPDDVRAVLAPVFAHRLILTPDAQLRDETVGKVIERIAGRVKPPLGVGGGQRSDAAENASA
jgi:MoxR-like ATPase